MLTVVAAVAMIDENRVGPSPVMAVMAVMAVMTLIKVMLCIVVHHVISCALPSGKGSTRLMRCRANF
jgi:hypothetical protein